jgi:hypothetical protein
VRGCVPNAMPFWFLPCRVAEREARGFIGGGVGAAGDLWETREEGVRVA